MRSKLLYGPVLLLLSLRISDVQGQSLTNGGFEGSYTTTAPGWNAITYGSPLYPTVAYGPETQVVHGGSTSQRLAVTDLGDGATLLVQNLDLGAGKTFEVRLWLRADQAMEVSVMLQERVPYYWVPAIAVVDVDTVWQEVVVHGGYDRIVPTDATTILSRLVVQPHGTGTLYVDNATFMDITTDVLNAPVALTDSIPGRYFGMHVNKWGVHQTWPPTGHGMMRLWNTGTTWELMEPWQGALLDPDNWVYDPGGTSGFGFRMELYTGLVQANDSTVELLYTMGKSPGWAASSSTLPPQDITWWQDYVQVLGNRYHDEVRYWEIWNEVDQLDYSGSLEDLKELTDSAASTLRAIDPDLVILSPNFSGAQQLAHFLKLGGGDEVDIISWHHYPGRMPEEMVPEIIGVRDVMARYGQGGKPLWNTEGAVSYMNGLNLPMDQQAGAVSRAYLVPWSFGVENFTWYCWDIFDGNSDYVDLSFSRTPFQYDSITPPGIAYQQTAEWLSGASMVSRSVTNGVWTIELARPGGYQAWVVWRPAGWAPFLVPGNWNIGQVRDLGGGTSPFLGGSLSVGPAPQLLEQGVWTGLEQADGGTDCTVAPNPTTGAFTISWSTDGPVDLGLYTASGHAVRQWAGVSGGKFVVAPGELPAGTYLVSVHSADGHRAHTRLVVLP